MNIIQAIEDPNLLKPIFRELTTWRAWIICLKTIFGLQMNEKETAFYRLCTGRQTPPTKLFKEVYMIVGRRGGKSFIVAVIAVFLSVFNDYSKFLSPGERGTIMILAVDKKQAGIILRYIKAIFSLPLFRSYVENDKAESIELTNRINIEVHTCSYRAVRGYTIVAAIMEESAFWRTEGVNPDREVYTALKPAMGTIPNSMLISISTPYSRQGLLYENFREHYGKEDEEVLVWKASSLTMNPSLSSKMIEKAKEKDPSGSRAEWEAEFREDIEGFLSLESIERVVIQGRVELPFIETCRYWAFTDPSGGGGDSFALSIGHKEGSKIVQDVLRARKGDPHEIVREYAEELKKYHVKEVSGDRYAGSWVSEAFRQEGITYKSSDLNKSELYLEALPFINSGMVELLDNREMVKELRLLERRRGSSGKDTVDHPRSIGGAAGHDDRANVTCGMIAGGSRSGGKSLLDYYKNLSESYGGKKEEESTPVPSMSGHRNEGAGTTPEELEEDRRAMNRLVWPWR
jgi:hypothetical protein